MTIQEIRANAETLTLEQLEAEKRARDAQHQALRMEEIEIRRLQEPRIVAEQRASQIAGAGKSTVLSVGGKR